MTVLPALPRGLPGLPAGVRDGLGVARDIVDVLSSPVVTGEIDRVLVVGELVDAHAVPTDLLRRLAAPGHGAEVVIEEGAFRAVVMWGTSGAPTVDATGPASDLVDAGDDEDELERAVLRDDVDHVLRAASGTTATVAVHVANDPGASGVHWAPAAVVLTDTLNAPRWTETLTVLARWDNERRATGATDVEVVVGDAGASWIRTDGLLILGPGATRPPPGTGASEEDESDAAFRERRTRAGRQPLPSPRLLAPVAGNDGVLEPLRPALSGLARAATWFWLAATAEEADADGTVPVTFRGVRTVEFGLKPGAAAVDACEDEVALYRWASATADPARDEAVQQATTFAVAGPGDLQGAAVPVLRTSRSVYELARRGTVAEALATRRAAREAGLASAREASRAARETAAKAVERSLATVVASAAIVFAHAGDLLGGGLAFGVLCVLAALTGASLAVALHTELPSGRSAITAFRQDASQYREALSQADVDALKNLATLTTAGDQLDRARTAACLIYGVVVAVVLAGGGIAVAAHGPPTSAPGKTVAPLPTPTGRVGAPPSPTSPARPFPAPASSPPR